jgi:hypothetical protein
MRGQAGRQKILRNVLGIGGRGSSNNVLFRAGMRAPIQERQRARRADSRRTVGYGSAQMPCGGRICDAHLTPACRFLTWLNTREPTVPLAMDRQSVIGMFIIDHA